MVPKESVLQSLRATPPIIMDLVRSVPTEILKQRPSGSAWSIHEHACHLAEAQVLMLKRLDQILAASDTPHIKGYQPERDDDPDALLSRDLTEALKQYLTDRHTMIDRIEALTEEEWTKKATHDEYKQYSISMMFRHLSMHDYLHAYRIEQILIEKEGPYAL